MNIVETLRQPLEPMDFRSYVYPGIQPPLELSSLHIAPSIGADRYALKTPVEGDASLVLSYKRDEAAVCSIAERCQGELWEILQLQGRKGGKGYRVASGLSWHKALGSRVKEYAQYPDADVRRLAMPPVHRVTNLTDAVQYDTALQRYNITSSFLGMRYSREEDLYIVDITKKIRAAMTSSVES